MRVKEVGWQLFFCNTSVPLTSTRWVRLTFSSPCPHYSKQGASINPSTIKKFQINFFGNAGTQTWGCWLRSMNATFVLLTAPPGGGSSYLEPGGPGSDEAVVGMPVEGGHSRLDRLLDVLRHPPVVLL